MWPPDLPKEDANFNSKALLALLGKRIYFFLPYAKDQHIQSIQIAD